MMSLEPNLNKIAVLRANALGDFIHSLPALQSLRAAYPKAEIVLLGRSLHQELLQHRPGQIDRVIVIPGSLSDDPALRADPETLEKFFQSLQQEQFDLALQLHGGGRHSNPFVLRLQSRLTVGLRTPDAVALDRWIPYHYYQSEVLRYLEVLSLIGVPPVTLQPHLAVTAADQAVIAALPELAGTTPLITLHPGATDPRRRWPIAAFAATADALSQTGAQIVVVGTEPEQAIATALTDQIQTQAINLCGQLSLSGLVGLLARSRLVIANDSGPLHLANAVGTPTIGIYWCGNLITAGQPFRCRHYPAISWQLNCPVCGLDCTQYTCSHQASFVASVSAEEVIQAARTLMSSSESGLSG